VSGPDANGLVSVSEAARAVGITRTCLRSAIRRGRVTVAGDRPGWGSHGRVQLVELAAVVRVYGGGNGAQPDHAPPPDVDAAVRAVVAEVVAELVDEVRQGALAAVREEVEAILGTLPAELVRVVGQRAQHLEEEARRCQAEAEHHAAARRALDEHRAEMSAVAARTAAAARAR
jgi:hypothetical protein